MAWIYLAASEDSPSPFQTGSVPSRTVKTIPSLKQSFCQGSAAWSFPSPPSGMMFGPYQPTNYRMWILSSEVFHARTSLLRAVVRAWRESEARFFSKSFDSLMNFDPPSFSWKMSQLSLFEDSTESPPNLPPYGMTVAGRLFQPPKLAPRTLEKDGGCLLPTPMAQRSGSNQGGSAGRTGKKRLSLDAMASQQQWPTPTARDYFPPHSKEYLAKKIKEGHGMANLSDAVSGNHPRWPTPTVSGNNQAPKPGTTRGTGLATAVKRWPTPTASCASKGIRTPEGAAREMARSSGPDLTTMVQVHSDQSGGQLNPAWVEWLMGYPSGWTVLGDLEMQWFLLQPKPLSKDLPDLEDEDEEI